MKKTMKAVVEVDLPVGCDRLPLLDAAYNAIHTCWENTPESRAGVTLLWESSWLPPVIRVSGEGCRDSLMLRHHMLSVDEAMSSTYTKLTASFEMSVEDFARLGS